MEELRKIKGVIPNLGKEYIIKTFGSEGFNEVLQAMQEQDREIISQIILSISWQPEKSFMNFLKAVTKTLGKNNLEICRNVGYYAAQEGIPKLYRIFISFGNPGFVIENCSRFWKHIHSFGSFEATLTNETSAVAKLYTYKDLPKVHCYYMLGYIQATLELSGAKNVSVHEAKCTSRNSEYCEFFAKWE